MVAMISSAVRSCLPVLIAGVCLIQGQLYGPNRAQTIGNIFQIPIQTLSAVSNVVQNTRPIGDVVVQRISRIQQLQNSLQSLMQQGSSSNQNAVFTNQQSQQASNRPLYSSINSVYSSQQFYRGQRQYPSRASQIAGLGVANDGSGFRI